MQIDQPSTWCQCSEGCRHCSWKFSGGIMGLSQGRRVVFKVASHSSQHMQSDMQGEGRLEGAFQTKRRIQAKAAWWAAAESQWLRVSGVGVGLWSDLRAVCPNESTQRAWNFLELDVAICVHVSGFLCVSIHTHFGGEGRCLIHYCSWPLSCPLEVNQILLWIVFSFYFLIPELFLKS